MSTTSRLITGPWTTSVAGLFCRDLHLRVPLDRSGAGDTLPDGSGEITVYAREVARRSALEAAPSELPALVFLQGGPGCESPRPGGDGGAGWLSAVLEHYRVILLDQRGTGASTPIDRPDAGGDARGTARLLTHFRADEIVEDCEDLRRAMGIERWSLLGQSFGGFCTIRYASAHPDSLETIYLTGGLPAVGRSLGASGGTDTLHYLLERDPESWALRYGLGQLLAFGGRFPLYAVIHESCWADGGVTGWAAARVRPAVFDDDPTLLTGEHVRPEFFTEDATLRPWREVAELVAHQEWPALYDPASLASGGVRGAAAVYARDVYVPMQTSLATAALVPGLRTWVTSEYEHNGSRASGGEVFRRLRDLAGGVVVR